MKSTSKTIVAGVVALVFLAVALILGIVVTQNVNEKTTPLVTTIIALIGVTIPAIIALNEIEKDRAERRTKAIPPPENNADTFPEMRDN